MKVLVGIKRVVDYAVKVRVSKGTVELANVKQSMNPFCEVSVVSWCHVLWQLFPFASSVRRFLTLACDLNSFLVSKDCCGRSCPFKGSQKGV
jgi:hypothetical protein